MPNRYKQVHVSIQLYCITGICVPTELYYWYICPNTAVLLVSISKPLQCTVLMLGPHDAKPQGQIRLQSGCKASLQRDMATWLDWYNSFNTFDLWLVTLCAWHHRQHCIKIRPLMFTIHRH